VTNIVYIDNPNADQQARGDPYCTLFVSRLSYETTEHDLEKEFSKFGPIERVHKPIPSLRRLLIIDSNREE
jgi:U1 small nuclear ribonucleoprotein